MTTDGMAAIISTTGLMRPFSLGAMNWLVYSAPRRASGMAKIMAQNVALRVPNKSGVRLSFGS